MASREQQRLLPWQPVHAAWSKLVLQCLYRHAAAIPQPTCAQAAGQSAAQHHRTSHVTSAVPWCERGWSSLITKLNDLLK